MDIQNLDARTPLILVTNDDGIESPGLSAVVEAVKSLGAVVVAAPTTQQTARGRSFVGNREDHFHPAQLTELREDQLPPNHRENDRNEYQIIPYHIDASPALTVRHALSVLFAQRYPDLIVSGVNYGQNLGSTITVSGTVGACLQAAAQGVPSIAISRQTAIKYHYTYGELDWSASVRLTHRWAKKLLELTFRGAWRPPVERPYPLGDDPNFPISRVPFDVLKVDLPDPCPIGTEERITSLSHRHLFLQSVENPTNETPISASRTWIDEDPTGLQRDDDIYATMIDRVVSVTPLVHDLTGPLASARTVLA